MYENPTKATSSLFSFFNRNVIKALNGQVADEETDNFSNKNNIFIYLPTFLYTYIYIFFYQGSNIHGSILKIPRKVDEKKNNNNNKMLSSFVIQLIM